MHFLLNLENFNLHENTHNYRSYTFRSSTIIRELVQSLAKVTLLLIHSVKLRRCILYGDVAAYREMACVLFVVQSLPLLYQWTVNLVIATLFTMKT